MHSGLMQGVLNRHKVLQDGKSGSGVAYLHILTLSWTSDSVRKLCLSLHFGKYSCGNFWCLAENKHLVSVRRHKYSPDVAQLAENEVPLSPEHFEKRIDGK